MWIVYYTILQLQILTNLRLKLVQNVVYQQIGYQISIFPRYFG